MTMTVSVRRPVGLIFDDGRPARFVWGSRWRVTSAEPDAFDYLGAEARVAGWRVSAQTEEADSEAAEFELVRDYAGGGWLLDSVVYR